MNVRQPVGVLATAVEALDFRPSLLELYEEADSMAEYSQTMPRHIKPTDIDALTTQAEREETTIRHALNDHDTASAVAWLAERGEISPELSERIEKVSLEFTENRLNRG